MDINTLFKEEGSSKKESEAALLSILKREKKNKKEISFFDLDEQIEVE